MKKRLIALLLLAVLAITPLAALANVDSYVKYIKGTSGGGSVRLRTDPNTNAEIITNVPYGTKVTAYDKTDGWFYVEYKGRYGWMMSRYLVDQKPAPHTPSSGGDTGTGGEFTGAVFRNQKAVGEYATVVPSTPGNFVNMRWAPTKAAPVVKKYYANYQLLVLSEGRGWCQVYDEATGDCGFILKKLTSRTES